MEAQDVLADQVHRGRPQLGEALRVGAVAGRGDVVLQRVHPHVQDVLVVPGQRDAPVEGGAGDGEVLQALLDEAQHLVAGRLGGDEAGVLGVELQQLRAVRGEAEEVVLLLQPLDRLLVDRAELLALGGTVEQLGGELVLLAADAVRAGVAALVDLALVEQVLDELLHPGGVPLLGGADEVVVGDLQVLPERLPGLLHQLVAPLLRGDAVGLRGAQDLLTVLVGAGQVPHPLAALAVPAGQYVARHGGVRVAQVGAIVDVVDRGGDVVRGSGAPGGAVVCSGRHGRQA